MPTPHINAQDNAFAKTVLMPGDPLRAKFIADNFLENAKLINEVRGMLAYTGTYQGKEISVMGSGMGMPSIGIYSHELYTVYGVENIIRIGTCGSLQKNVAVYDLIIAQAASTNSNWLAQYNLPGTYAPIASYSIIEKIIEAAKNHGKKYHVGNILSSDIFYDYDPEAWKKWANLNILAVEMEAAALFMNATRTGKNAACILTVSDSLVTGESTSAEERQNSFKDMMQVALEAAIKL